MPTAGGNGLIRWTFWLVALVTLVADLASKHWVFAWLRDRNPPEWRLWDGVIHINLQINEGAVWGVLQGRQVVLLTLTALIVPLVIWMAHGRPNRQGRRAPAWALGLLLGGALGNLYDRIFVGETLPPHGRLEQGVRDFVQVWVTKDWHWPVFNVADIAIVLGVGVYILWSIFLENRGPSADQPVDPSAESPPAASSGPPPDDASPSR